MPLLEVGPGELVDRLTILRLKALNARAPETREAAERQLSFVAAALHEMPAAVPERMIVDLQGINADLWAAEDRMRHALAARPPDHRAVYEISRAIVDLNGARCAAKAAVDHAMGFVHHAEFKIYE